MKIIRVNTIEIEVNEDKIVRMMECVTMETNQEILIRNKKDTIKLSKQIAESSKIERQQRYLEAVENKDRLYLQSLYDSLSIKDVLEMIFFKVQKRF